jgi:type I restriction enzyme S subunit
MDLNTFLEHFDTIAEAPGGIAKLKALILDLAVRGKLVPQDPEDEPASTILDKIAFGKRAVVKQAKSEKSKLLNDQKTETLFELPKSWQWAKLNDLTSLITDGEHATPARVSRPGVPLGTAKNIRDGFLDFSNTDYVSFETAEKCWKRCRPTHNDILMVCVGATTGRLCLVKQPPDFVIVRSVALIRPFENLVYPEYLALAINSPVGQSEVWGNVKQSAQPCLYINKMQILSLPTPPLAEQKRIVEKVNELMALCDRFSAAKQTRDDLRQKLRGSAIAALMNAETDEALEKSWAIVRDNWHTLSQDPKDVDELRQPILKLALQGKLTSPIFSKVVLEELIERFIAERLSLYLSEQDKNKILLELDKTYKRLEEKDSQLTIAARCICDFITKGTTPANNELLSRGEIPYIKVYNIVEQELNFFYKPTYISREVHETKLKRSKVLPGDVLMNIVGPPLGKVAIVPDTFQEWNLNQALAIFRPLPSVNERFLYYALSCYATLKTVLNETRGTAGQDNLSLEQCRDLQIPVFTVEDQGRIVAKVDELMQMCDQLEANLCQSQQRAAALAASAISHLTI